LNAEAGMSVRVGGNPLPSAHEICDGLELQKVIHL
jgi:hypothetical protein